MENNITVTKSKLEGIMGGNFIKGKLYVFAFPANKPRVYSNIEVEVYKLLATMEPVTPREGSAIARPLAVIARKSWNSDNGTNLMFVDSAEIVGDQLNWKESIQRDHIEPNVDIQDVMTWTAEKLKSEAMLLDAPVIYFLPLNQIAMGPTIDPEAPGAGRHSIDKKWFGFIEALDLLCATAHDPQGWLQAKVLKNRMKPEFDPSIINIDIDGNLILNPVRN